ncbi:BZ3500_MvSof-1268-A1-R1_Chr5-2g07738 [Microbotryum saponariae]|uniref:Phosphatidate cytidylyltransferase n=1 Tax=Microbotryum saponariae TaxID=289078 RepID=A0A2X0KFJ6_9BASI|nr:BZ3500_MvSof-1268-A1-R1_Chr5-2g07738 [Microbotryum saponariae]SDA05607.1 BZ3501_MvSof-1269-A2-R1_Chr5-2g07560 [Microbotryum saponariae]
MAPKKRASAPNSKASSTSTSTSTSTPSSATRSRQKATATAPAAAPVVIDSVSSSDVESVVADYTDGDDDDSDVDAQVERAGPATPTGTVNPVSASKDHDFAARLASPARLPSTPKSPSSKKGPVEAYTGADHDPNKKVKAIIERTVWGFVMGGGAIALVAAGHLYCIVLVFLCQAVVFSELTSLFDVGYSNTVHESAVAPVHPSDPRAAEKELRRKGRREERNRYSRRMSWYFFAVTNYFLYGESLIYYFKHILTLQTSFLPSAFTFAQHHRLISFGLYTLGFVSFVANLDRAQLRRQFGLFGWIHMSLLLIVVSSHFIVNNILEGMIWFFIPATIVITNDIAAYACGMAFGRHQLIKLSPKKTVEGFVGAFFVTIAIAVAVGTLFMRSDYMICPVQDLSSNAFSAASCTPNPVFNWYSIPLPSSIVAGMERLTGGHAIRSLWWTPFQFHLVVLAIFASLVAPFGGFFASGFKRAFNIKDFGDSIPGHGGMTDRMDCQFLMGWFTYVYYASLIRVSHVTVTSLMAQAASALTTQQQVELLRELNQYLVSKGVKTQIGI